MLRPKPTMISLSMKDVAEHMESIDRKSAKARAEGAVNSSSMRQPLGSLYTDNAASTMAEEPRVIYLNERDTRMQGITPIPISTDMMQSFDLSIRSRDSAESADHTPRVRSLDTATPHGGDENRTTTSTDPDDDSVSLGFLESERGDGEEPSFTEDQDSMMTEVPGASPIPWAPRPSMDYADSSFEGSSRDSSSFGTMDLSPNVTIRKKRKPSSRLTLQVPEDASTPPAPMSEAAQNSLVQMLRARHPVPRSPLFRSIDSAQTPMRATTVGFGPRLNSPGTPSTLFSQPPRSSRTYRQREMTYSYDESENPNAGEVQIYEDHTAHPLPYDDDDYYDHDGNYNGQGTEEERDEQEQEEEEISDAQEVVNEEQSEAGQHSDNLFHGVHSLRYRERSSHHDSSTTTDDMEEALPSSPPMYISGASGGNKNMSRSSRTLVQNLQSAAASMESGRPGLPSSPSLQLPPPFSASPRQVSDSSTLPAMPSMYPSSEDDRGRGRTKFPRLDDVARPSSIEAHAGDSPASPASPRSPYDNSQQDGSPGSRETSRSNSTTLPIRLGLPRTDGAASAHSSRSPHTSWASHIAGAFPAHTPDAVGLPPPARRSPSRDRSRHMSPIAPTRQPSGPPYMLAPDEQMSSSTDGGDHGSTPTQVYPRPLPRPPVPPFQPVAGGSARPLPPLPIPSRPATGTRPLPAPPIPTPGTPGHRGLTRSAPQSALEALVTVPGTRRPERLPWAQNPNRDRPLPTLPMRLPPRTPGGSRIRVYDDSISTSLQPQTPDDLPESRHRSRFHPSYTAPPAQNNEPREYRRGGRMMEGGRRGRAATRSESPLVARGTGFEGLGRGAENADDEELWRGGRDAVRRRLFEGERTDWPRRVQGRWGSEWRWEGDAGRIERLEGGVGRRGQ